MISNGVVNLSPDKPAVFAAAAAALRPGGRLAIADIVSATQLPDGITCDASLWAACIGGAMQRDRYLETTELAVVEYIAWFNNDRLHEALGDVSPVKFESLYVAQEV